MKTMFKVKVCLLMLLCSVAAAMANPPVPVVLYQVNQDV